MTYTIRLLEAYTGPCKESTALSTEWASSHHHFHTGMSSHQVYGMKTVCSKTLRVMWCILKHVLTASTCVFKDGHNSLTSAFFFIPVYRCLDESQAFMIFKRGTK